MQEFGLIKSSPEDIYLKACSASFSQSTECLIPDLHPELLSAGVEGQRLQWLVTYFILVEANGNCQFLVDACNYPFPTAPKDLTHASNNSKPKVSSQYHLNQIWVKVKV